MEVLEIVFWVILGSLWVFGGLINIIAITLKLSVTNSLGVYSDLPDLVWKIYRLAFKFIVAFIFSILYVIGLLFWDACVHGNKSN